MGSTDRAFLFQQIDRLYRGGAAAAQDDSQLLALFIRNADQQAFEALVRRHGPMVLALCRKLLRDPSDIEDAFQATFLVLARRAGTIRDRTVLSSWLYGVAHRVATRCRSDLLRRKAMEVTADVLEFPANADSPSMDELGPALHQEVNRLPEKYRAPIVLCYFQDQTHDQAAAELNWPVGTVRSRLARGRELLRGRLTRRGCTPVDVAFGLTAGLSPRSFLTQVPSSLIDATLASFGRFVGSGAVSGGSALVLTSSLSGSASTLAQGVLSTMAVTQYSWIGTGVAALALIAGATGAGAWALAPREDGKPGVKPAAVAKLAETPAAKASNVATPLPAAVAGGERTEPDVSARLAELERKLDLLLRMQGGMSSRTAAVTEELPSVQPSSAMTESLPSLQPSSSRSSIQSTGRTRSLGRSASAPVAASSSAPARIAEARTISPESHSPLPSETEVSHLEPVQPEPVLAEPGLPSVTGASPLEPAQPEPVLAEPHPERVRSARSLGDDDDPFTAAQVASPSNTRSARNTVRDNLQPRDPFAASPVSLHEIEAQIQIAWRKIDHKRDLWKKGVISNYEIQLDVDELRLLIAKLKGMDEALTEASEQSNAEQSKLNAELDRIEAQLAVSTTVTARNQRLNNRKPGMVSEEEVAKAESETMAVKADMNEKEAEMHLAALKLKHLESRSLRIRRLIEETVGKLKETEPPPTPAR